MNLNQLIRIVVGGVLVLGASWLAILWLIFRVTVAPGESLILIRKSGALPPAGQVIAGPGEKGIQREALGPGRYFLNPLTWSWERHPLVTISAGDPVTWATDDDTANPDLQAASPKGSWPEVGVVVNRVGKTPPPGSPEVVGPEHQGIQQEVLTPGVYRINPYVYEIKKAPATVIPLGYAGVLISRMGEVTATSAPATPASSSASVNIQGRLAATGERGVLRNVLQPGIYYLNPYAYQVQVIWVGYNLMSQTHDGDAGEVISFPSKDGFTIDVDITVVWGLHPAHTPAMISGVGDTDRIKTIILGQIRSICRNVGSDFLSTDFIQGEKRELYQRQVTDALRVVCEERDIEILIALIQNIEVRGGAETKVTDSDLKRTIQRGFIAREQDLTKQTQRETAKILAGLEAAKSEIPVSRERVTAETRMKVAETKAEAIKRAQEIDAQRDLQVAQLERQIAELEAETTLVLGRATAEAEQLANQADADGKRMMVEAFGDPRSYNLFIFAENFSPDSIRLMYAGEGTFWTDLSRMQDAAASQLLVPREGKP